MMVRLLARVTQDGYLLGTTDDLARGWEDRFWSDYYEEGHEDNGLETIPIDVPREIKQALLDHGTSLQTYSDGYEAWQDVISKGEIYE